MEYADKPACRISPSGRIHFVLQPFGTYTEGGSSYALRLLDLRRRACRATLYGSSSYAVEPVASGSTAQLDHLYRSQSGTLRLSSLRRRAYLAEPYSVARKAVRDSSSSSTAHRYAPCGIARLSMQIAISDQKKIRISTLA